MNDYVRHLCIANTLTTKKNLKIFPGIAGDDGIDKSATHKKAGIAYENYDYFRYES